MVYVVSERKHDSPVYIVLPERGSGKMKILHRNLLLPCDFLPGEEEEQEENKMEQRKSNADRKKKKQVKQEERDPDNIQEDESTWPAISTHPTKPSDQAWSQLRGETEEVQPPATQRELRQGFGKDVA